jgi:hypothetical protein
MKQERENKSSVRSPCTKTIVQGETMTPRRFNACFILVAAMLLTSACWGKETKPMTLEEVKTLKFHVSVEGVAFDVPVNYHHEEFAMLKVWPRPPQAQVERRERPKVDVIKITALLPDVEPYTEANAVEFEKPGWGKKVEAYMTKRRVNWKYYFDNFSQRLVKLPESPEVSGMLHYRDSLARHDVYFSHDHPDPNLTRIICPDSSIDKAPSPSCHVQTVYMDRFDLKITFARPYLGQWRDIERKLKALFDRFHESAQQEQPK